MQKERLLGVGLFAGLAILVGVGLWQTHRPAQRTPVVLLRHPRAVMGTTCSLAVLVDAGDRPRAEEALKDAEAVLRAIEARMSSWLADSEISRFNKAVAGGQVSLSPDTLEVLRAAQQAVSHTEGAFDVTCRPLIELWRQAGQQDALPEQPELDRARAASGWELIELTDTAALKRATGVCLDLGGIAKGHAIDRALDVLRQAGMAGGLVDVGGDLRCFGRPPDGQSWTVDVQDPFGPGRLLQLKIPGGAVATSGHYARRLKIAGRHYSHIIDPRTGRPADTAASVTVIAPSARDADVWATALSVLGADGFDRLPDRLEALLVVGTPADHQILCTPGCRRYIVDPPRTLVVKSP